MTAPLDIAKLRELLGKATGGEWFASTARSSIVGCPVVASPDGRHIAGTTHGVDDAAFIAAAKNAMGELLDRLERAEKLLGIRDRQQAQSSRLWLLAGEKALQGDFRDLRLRVDLANAPPVDVVPSDSATPPEPTP